jgi:hypothetical protein
MSGADPPQTRKRKSSADGATHCEVNPTPKRHRANVRLCSALWHLTSHSHVHMHMPPPHHRKPSLDVNGAAYIVALPPRPSGEQARWARALCAMPAVCDIAATKNGSWRAKCP